MKKLQDALEISINNKTVQAVENNFNNALKDEEFKRFIKTIDAEKSELMRNTTSLKKSFKEYQNCLDCKNIYECNNDMEGHLYSPKKVNGVLRFGYKSCHYQNAINKKYAHLDNISIFNIPEEIKKAEFKDIYPKPAERKEAILWLKRFIDEYKNGNSKKGLYLHGNFGCGKSFLVAAAFGELAKVGIESAIVFWPEFLNTLKASFNIPYSNEFDKSMQFIKSVPLLLIDDIGAENSTPWSRDDILCPIVQYRMDKELTTFFTSNLDYKALEEHLSISKNNVEAVKARRIIERIKQLTVEQELISANLRK